MKIHHLRSATMLLTLGEQRLLVDPMLCKAGVMPGFKLFGGGRRPNPLVSLPSGSEEALAAATGILVTHRHPDHLDEDAMRWIRERDLPVWTNPQDAPKLRKKKLDARVLTSDALGMHSETIPVRHGRGVVGWLCSPVSSYFLSCPGEPKVYLTADAVLTPELLQTVQRLQPDVIVAPAGSANFGWGGDILFSVDELVTLIQKTESYFVLNHLESLDHCPTQRHALQSRMEKEGLAQRVFIPQDGQTWSWDER